MELTRIYADRSGRAPIERAGLPREVLAELRAEGWDRPYVVQLIRSAPKPDTRAMPWH